MTTESSAESSLPAQTRHARPTIMAGLIILGIGAALQWLNWWGWGEDTTFKVFTSIYVLLPATALALLVWWFVFSRLDLATRLTGFGVLVSFAVLFLAAFRIDGVDGVMRPQISGRWTKSPETIAREFREQEAAQAAARASEVKDPEGENKPTGGTFSQDQDNDPLVLSEGDWPHFRGPERDLIVRGLKLPADWNRETPQLLWERPCGLGWSSFAAVGSRLYTQEQIEENESVVCYDAATGRELWRHSDETRLDTSLGGDGPRATPTFYESRIYALGGTGILNCLDARTGRKIWSTDILSDAGIAGIDDAALDWGMSGSPLVDDRYVYVNPGISRANPGQAAVAAYDRKSGKKVWSSGDTKAGYASPFPMIVHGTRQIVLFDAAGVAGYDPEAGTRLWKYGFTNSQSINVAQPLPINDHALFVSSGYGAGAVRIEISRKDDQWSAKEAWRTPNQFKLKFNDGVLRNGYVYALDEGILACLNVETGERVWRQGRYRYGELLLVAGESPENDRLIVQTESGELVLVTANPEKPEELGRFQAIKGTCWNHPIIHNGVIYVRSEQFMAAYRLTAKP